MTGRSACGGWRRRIGDRTAQQRDKTHFVLNIVRLQVPAFLAGFQATVPREACWDFSFHQYVVLCLPLRLSVLLFLMRFIYLTSLHRTVQSGSSEASREEPELGLSMIG